MKTKYYLLFDVNRYHVSDLITNIDQISHISYNKELLKHKADKLNGVLMRYNYTYYGAPISKADFEKNVPENWKSEFHFWLFMRGLQSGISRLSDVKQVLKLKASRDQ